jgi:hypothetical protein
VLSHGLWESKEDAIELLINLDKQANEDYYIAICYEDANKEANVFKQHIENTLRSALKHAKIVYYASKKPKWQVIKEYMSVPCVQHFKVLDFSSWHTLIPIPWLWKKLYYNKPQFNTEVFKLVDGTAKQNDNYMLFIIIGGAAVLVIAAAVALIVIKKRKNKKV